MTSLLKVDAALFIALFCSLALVSSRELSNNGRSLNRDRLRDGSGTSVACNARVVEAAKKCSKEFEDKVKGRGPDNDNSNSKDMKCCMFAEFQRCIHDYAATACARTADSSTVVETVIKGMHPILAQDCEQQKDYQRRICYQGMTHSTVEFDYLLKEAIGDVRKVLITRTQKFDEFFRELLKNSKRDFHQMFLQTYGLLYEKHSYIFTDMFADLEKYYMTGGVDLTDALDNFFQHLYQKMFQVLNGQYAFDEHYLQCVGEYMDELKPFGDIPKKLKIEVKRSFVATRTFVQALSNGKDVLGNVMELSPSLECSQALMRMTCPHCQGLADTKPCASFCTSVMRTCLSVHAELNKEWNNYIDALLLLSSRLETSFNIESVVDPIDIKISEAIMNFQENGIVVSTKLFEKCGKPRIGKREAVNDHLQDGSEDLMDNGFDDFNTYRSNQQPHHSSRIMAAGTSMDRLIEDIKRKIKRTKDYWTRLPGTLCSHRHFGASSSSASSRDQARSCWNGTATIQNDLDKFDAFESEKKSYPTQPHKPNAVIGQQILTLKLITTKVNYAYNGLEVEWQDNGGDADSDDISGSGSGAGPEPGLDEDGYSGPINPGAKGTSDIYFDHTSSTEATGSSSSSNDIGNHVPNSRYPHDKSTPNQFPNNINVINVHKQRASSCPNLVISPLIIVLSSLLLTVVFDRL